MIIDSQNLIISVQCRRFGDYMSSRLNECCITTDIQPLLYKSENSGFADKILLSVNVIPRFYSYMFLYSKATNAQDVSFFIKDAFENNSIGTDEMIGNFAGVVQPDHASMVRHGQAHGRFSSPFPSENENDHVTMLILDTYMHGGEVSLFFNIGTHVHGQHGHVNIWSIMALKSDHEGDHDLTMPDHVFPKFVEVIQNVAL